MAADAHIGINGLFLDHPLTGTGVYTREVSTRLALAQEGLSYTIFGHPEHMGFMQGFGGISYVGMRALPGRPTSNAEKIMWEQVALPKASLRHRIDLLFSPYFSLPIRVNTRTTLTVHDVIPLILPEYAPSSGLKAYFRLVSAAARRADAVVTDSKHSAGDVARVLGVHADRVHVIYLGVDQRFRQPVVLESVRELRVRLGLPERFMLYLGGTDPRKNTDVLLNALRVLRDRGQRVMPLALVASRRSSARHAAWEACDPRANATRLGVTEQVQFLDWIDEVDKPALYAAARAFVFPSRYEGFGLPPLEAMAAGTPVLCSSASSLPEVVGNAGLLLNPDDAESWADALVRIDEDASLREELALRGREQAAQFTWERTTAELAALFRRLVVG